MRVISLVPSFLAGSSARSLTRTGFTKLNLKRLINLVSVKSHND